MNWETDFTKLPTLKRYYGKWYLCTTDDGQVLAMNWHAAVVGGKTVCRWEWNCRISTWKVIAFMEFPQAYQPKENKQLKKLLQLAADDMSSIADSIANTHKLLADSEDEVCNLKLGRCDVCDRNCQYDSDGNAGCNFKWQHADELNNLIK